MRRRFQASYGPLMFATALTVLGSFLGTPAARAQLTYVETEIQNFEAGQNDYFGARVKIDGDTLVIGVPFDDPAAGADAGSVYVYVRDGASWAYQDTIHPTDPAAGDLFGNGVSIAGDWLAVGASRDDDLGVDSGSVYVFNRSGAIWTQHVKITAFSGGDSGDHFGAAIGIDTSIPAEDPGAGLVTTLVIGAPDDEVLQPFCCAGSIYIYELSGDGTAWNFRHNHPASDSDTAAEFGAAVAIDGDGIIVGAPEMDGGLAGIYGKAYFFQRRTIIRTWTEEFQFLSGDPNGGDRFGNSVGVQNRFGNFHVVIGVPNDDHPVAGFDAGVVFEYHGNTNNWTMETLLSSEVTAGAKFGDAVDINNEMIVVGEPQLDVGGNDTGAVHVFGLNPSGLEWEHLGRLLSGFLAGAGRLGDRVGVSGSTVVGGEPNERVGGGSSVTLVGEVAVFDLDLSIFSDGFESGDTTLWSATVQ